jgi:hypothetical protein
LDLLDQRNLSLVSITGYRSIDRSGVSEAFLHQAWELREGNEVLAVVYDRRLYEVLKGLVRNG